MKEGKFLLYWITWDFAWAYFIRPIFIYVLLFWPQNNTCLQIYMTKWKVIKDCWKTYTHQSTILKILKSSFIENRHLLMCITAFWTIFRSFSMIYICEKIIWHQKDHPTCTELWLKPKSIWMHVGKYQRLQMDQNRYTSARYLYLQSKRQR